jgi:hypothetical protein
LDGINDGSGDPVGIHYRSGDWAQSTRLVSTTTLPTWLALSTASINFGSGDSVGIEYDSLGSDGIEEAHLARMESKTLTWLGWNRRGSLDSDGMDDGSLDLDGTNDC